LQIYKIIFKDTGHIIVRGKVKDIKKEAGNILASFIFLERNAMLAPLQSF